MRGALQGLDPNHVSKNLYGALLRLRSSLGWGGRGKGGLRLVDIQYLKVKWCYVMKGLRNEPGLDLKSEEATQRGVNGIRIMVKHAFGRHDECPDHIVVGKDGERKEWCTYSSDRENYKSSIKGGVPLCPDTPRGHLAAVETTVCGTYGTPEVIRMLMHTLSTNENESFHSTIVATAAGGKRSNLGARGSYLTSALCALCCKNDGHTYVLDLYREVGIEPPEATKHQAIAREDERTRCALRKKQPSYKKNKREKKEKINNSDRSGSIVKLGKERMPAYSSGCLFEDPPLQDPPLVVESGDDSSDSDSDVDSDGSGGAPAYAGNDEDEGVGQVDLEVQKALDKCLMPHQKGNEEARKAFSALIEARRAEAMDV